jgi:hypothetical protein
VGDLPKLLTKAFAIGYLLPAIGLVVAFSGVFHVFGRTDALLKLLLPPDATLAVISLVAVSFTAILLLALNHALIRLLEGYGKGNPARIFHFHQRRKFRKLHGHMTKSKAAWDAAAAKKQPVDPAVVAGYGDALWQIACSYPASEEQVLPTRFGNIVRAFEVYPRVVYGVESTVGWTRLHGVITREYRELINEEKSQVDFWVNTWFTGWLCLLVYALLAALDRSLPSPWIPFVAVAVAFGAARSAGQAAYNWGVLVTSSFDLFRENLATMLGLKLPRTIEREREMWQTASQVWVYRSDKAAKKLDAFRTDRNTGKKKR